MQPQQYAETHVEAWQNLPPIPLTAKINYIEGKPNPWRRRDPNRIGQGEQFGDLLLALKPATVADAMRLAAEDGVRGTPMEHLRWLVTWGDKSFITITE